MFLELKNYKFGCKLVRGAYMVMERRHAKDAGTESPIWETLEDTHASYNKALTDIIERIGRKKDVEVMLATHNQDSVKLALDCMVTNKISPKYAKNSGVYFGQLLGMADNITFPLGGFGYKAYKYVPYGQINEVMPYLLRRAQENSDALSASVTELKLIKSEVKRRIM